MRINNIWSDFEEIVSGVPQGSMIRPILFIAFLNSLFYFIENVTAHNFSDDNNLSCFSDDNSLPWFTQTINDFKKATKNGIFLQ